MVDIKDESKQGILEYVQTEKKPYQCNICNDSFSYKVTLKKHVKSVHEKNIQFKCSICNNTFSRKNGLKSHMESVHEKIKRHKCSICNIGFYKRGNLINHKSVHEKKILKIAIFVIIAVQLKAL